MQTVTQKHMSKGVVRYIPPKKRNKREIFELLLKLAFDKSQDFQNCN